MEHKFDGNLELLLKHVYAPHIWYRSTCRVPGLQGT
jgi:hypothetical protein